VVKLVDNFDNKYDYITNDGRTFFFLTNRDAPKYKVVKATLFPPRDPREKDPKALADIKFEVCTKNAWRMCLGGSGGPSESRTHRSSPPQTHTSRSHALFI
jgi:hypothetical protein